MAYQPLFAYVESKTSQTLTAEEKEKIQRAFQTRHLRKRQYLLQEGDVCKYMAFIVKGAGRLYTMKENSQQTTIRLAVESWWLGDYESYNFNLPSIYYIEMIEESVVLLVTHESLVELALEVPAIDEMVRKIDQKGTVAAQKRVHAAISLDAEERYELLAKTYPEFIKRFPQSMIASYLGISPETLSRVRKKNLYR
jgi:CRP-like cAMP-binding protein